MLLRVDDVDEDSRLRIFTSVEIDERCGLGTHLVLAALGGLRLGQQRRVLLEGGRVRVGKVVRETVVRGGAHAPHFAAV